MAAGSFSLNAIVQDVFQATDAAQQQVPASATPANANQAQGAPTATDTVTLTNQTAQDQQTGPDPQQDDFDRAAFLGAAAAYTGTNTARRNRKVLQPILPLLPPQTQNAATAAADTAANTATNTADTANAPAVSDAAGPNANASAPQQQLQMLDQTLQQLGINPQSIPLFNRMAMLLYANNPAALRLLVQTLQGAATQQGAAQTTNTAENANQGAVQALLPAGAPANQGQGSSGPAPTGTSLNVTA
jgi:hypothetical protein